MAAIVVEILVLANRPKDRDGILRKISTQIRRNKIRGVDASDFVAVAYKRESERYYRVMYSHMSSVLEAIDELRSYKNEWILRVSAKEMNVLTHS